MINKIKHIQTNKIHVLKDNSATETICGENIFKNWQTLLHWEYVSGNKKINCLHCKNILK